MIQPKYMQIIGTILLIALGVIIGKYSSLTNISWLSPAIMIINLLLTVYNYIQSYYISQQQIRVNLSMRIQSKINNIVNIFLDNTDLRPLYRQMFLHDYRPVIITPKIHQMSLIIINAIVEIIDQLPNSLDKYKCYCRSIFKQWFKSPILQQIWRQEQLHYPPRVRQKLTHFVGISS